MRKAFGTAVFALAIVTAAIHLKAQGQRGAPGPITTGYPQRPQADPGVLERGQLLYTTNCAFCHGADARGGDGGSNLLRSEIVLNDQQGELIGDILRNGVSTMTKFEFSNQQVSDLAAFIHSFRVAGYDSSRFRPDTIVVGDAKTGEAYFKRKCATCHDVNSDLKGFAARVDDPRTMQQTWLMPGARGTRPSRQPSATVVVTLESGQQLKGDLVRMDDFVITLLAADSTQYTLRRDIKNQKVEVRDPLASHRDLLRSYSDKDIHDVTAYLESLK
jgi:cytochrome c oxidase cbb3-type subunit III